MKYFIVSLCIPFSLACMSPEYDNDNELDISYSVSFPTSFSFPTGEMSSIFCYNIRPSDEDYQKQSPLHAAIEKNDKEQFKALLSQQDIDVNQKDYLDESPLHIAARESHGAYFIKELARNPHINFTSKNTHGFTPFDVGMIELGEEGSDNTSSIQQLIRISPHHCKIVNHDSFMIAIKRIKESNGATAVAIKDVLEDLARNDVTFDASLSFDSSFNQINPSFFKYLSKYPLDTDRNDFYLSLIKSGYPLNTPDSNQKLPIDYAWNGNSTFLISTMLDYGSGLPLSLADDARNTQDKKDKFRNIAESADKQNLSIIKSRLMITNTAQFIKNKKLGKKAVSRNLRINEKAKRIAKTAQTTGCKRPIDQI